MTLTMRSINAKMNKISELVKIESFDAAYKEYQVVDNGIETMQYIVSETNESERKIVAEFYSSYAYFLFSFSEYSQFFKMYIKAQKYGYPFEKRRKFIYETFIGPNMDSFKSNYAINIENMKAEGFISNPTEFEELPYWLITTGNQNEYYLYDKETDMIRDRFILDIKKNSQLSDTELLTKDLSDYIITSNGYWPEVQSYVNENNYQRKKSYIVTKNVGELLSCFQGGIADEDYFNKVVIFENIEKFEQYFIESNHYLPRTVIGDDRERNRYVSLMEEIHDQRIKKEKTSDHNILLSICIPSYNRGKRAYDNVMHTLKSDFNAEIEIIVSNNGTKNDSKEYYEKIKEIEDPRLTYFEFQENQGFALNLSKAVGLARGKYVLMLSDEDLVDLGRLKYIISALDSYEERISIIRTRSDGQGIVPFVGMAKSAEDSLLKFMLTSNYMSGVIFNRELLEKHQLTKYIKDNLDNEACSYYPHMVWELILCQYGNVWGADIILINEGHAEAIDAPTLEIGNAQEKTMPYYATFEGRLAQHKGFYDVIKELEISKNDFDMFRRLYKKLCVKTIFLVSLSINAYYKEIDTNTEELLESAYKESLSYLEEMYQGSKNSNKHVEDMKEIEGYYKHFQERS